MAAAGASPPRRRSVVDSFGVELTSVVTPVSICMALTVMLVRLLHPEEKAGDVAGVGIATMYYQEKESDAVGEKLAGSLVNGLIFVFFITVVTFLLVLCFKYGLSRFIWIYMGFAGLQIFGVLGGILALQVIAALDITVDFFTFFFLLWNFTIVGVTAVFGGIGPLALKQGYLIFVGVVTAFWFTRIPEFTTWVLLALLAIYDILAVLTPGGPLKILVDISTERNEEMPALVYEARPTSSVATLGMEEPREAPAILAAAPKRRPRPPQPEEEEEGGDSPRQAANENCPRPGNENGDEDERAILNNGTTSQRREPSQVVDAEAIDSIKLGMGDFIFYSLLVGRAALYDLLSAYSCYFAIIAGLCMTLVVLSFYQRALPALPFSIALGVVFYFMARFFTEPLVLGLQENLMAF